MNGLAKLAFIAAFSLAISESWPSQSLQEARLDIFSYASDALRAGRFLAVHGRKSLISGFVGGDLEVWAYPLQLVTGYHVGFRPSGQSSEIPASSALASVKYLPDAIERTYIGTQFVIKENLFVPLDQPAAFLTYSVESAVPVQVVVHFTPVLNLMWPAAIGGQSLTWKNSPPRYLLTDARGKFAAEIGSMETVAHDDAGNVARPPGGASSFDLTILAAKGKPATVVVVRLQPGGVSLLSSLESSRVRLESEAASHYRDVSARSLQIETPDPSVNRNLWWSQLALDQAWVCNDTLGCGLVAGYGPSRGARRPQYDWFFAGDALVSTHALVSAGEYARARDALSFLIRYQDSRSGMMWHEMSQSAGELNWAKDFPYMFVHVDITFDYLASMANYVSTTGDKAFLAEHWISLRKAYAYCSSLLDPSDGLPRIPVGKEGANEQDRMTDDIRLSASWVAAARGYAFLASLARHQEDAGRANNAASRAIKSLEQRYWDPSRQSWIGSFNSEGKPVLDDSIRPALVPAAILGSQHEQETLDSVATAAFQTDWGARGIATNSPSFNAESYAKGSVWALSSAELAKAFWSAHRPVTAYAIWDALQSWSTVDSFGHLPEVLAGDFYHEQQESVPEQTWSSAGYLDAFLSGLAGITVDGTENRLRFSPHLPPAWPTLKLKRVRVGNSVLSFSLTRSLRTLTLDIVNDGPPVQLVFSPQIPLGARVSSVIFEGQRANGRVNDYPGETDVTVECSLKRGASHLRLDYAGGVLFEPISPEPLLGDISHGPKVVRFTGDGTAYKVVSDVDTSRPAKFRLFTSSQVIRCEGAVLEPAGEGQYNLTVSPAISSTSANYERKEVDFQLEPR